VLGKLLGALVSVVTETGSPIVPLVDSPLGSPEGASAKRRVLPASLTGSGQKGPKTRKLRSTKQSPDKPT
jgi:hypothetical protein